MSRISVLIEVWKSVSPEIKKTRAVLFLDGKRETCRNSTCKT